jgi:hypothetical protein
VNTRLILSLSGAMILAALQPLFADDADHFREDKVSLDEARILALTGTREMKCNYEINPGNVTPFNKNAPNNLQEDFNLFAEFYRYGRCVGRYRLLVAVNGFDSHTLSLKGGLSLGWNANRHELTVVVENGESYSPWSGSVTLKDFVFVDGLFFANSLPEHRKPDNPQSPDFDLRPVAGLCGDRNLKIRYSGVADAASFLRTCEAAHATNAVIVYLYKSTCGEEPALIFNPSP